MAEKYLLLFFRRAIGILGGIYNNPRKLALFCLLLVVSFVISVREYRKDRDEGPIWGKIVNNTLWQSLGLGLPLAVLIHVVGRVVLAVGMSRPGRALIALAKYVLLPYKFHLVENHHSRPDGSTTFWTVAVGWWTAALEAVVGLWYCLTYIGIPFGIKHLKLAFVIWGPQRFRVLNDVEYDELLDSRHTMSGRSRSHESGGRV